MPQLGLPYHSVIVILHKVAPLSIYVRLSNSDYCRKPIYHHINPIRAKDKERPLSPSDSLLTIVVF